MTKQQFMEEAKRIDDKLAKLEEATEKLQDMLLIKENEYMGVNYD